MKRMCACVFTCGCNLLGKISLRDLKRCRLTPQFLNTFINIEKYLDYEQKDPSPLKVCTNGYYNGL